MSARIFSLVSALALAFTFIATPARAQDDQGDDAPIEGDTAGTEDAQYARVAALQGELFVKGPFDDQEQPATVNAFLREGDELRTGADTFVELELPHATFIRIAPQTAGRMQTIAGQVEFDLVRGSVYLSQGADAPDAAIVAERGSVGTFSRTVVRLESETGISGYAIARVAEGSAEASCEGKFSTLSVRQTLSCSKDGVRRGEWSPEKGDAFDRWNQEREKRVRNYQAPPAQVAGNYEGMQDLDGNGEWVTLEHQYYWHPYVDVSWRPYNDGYWAWCDWLGGWTWVAYQPWGHVTHHYGRWIWVGTYGWVWSPAPVFSPAWVVWASFDGYLGWAPCDFWGRPIVVASTHTYYDHYAWTFSRPKYFVGGGGNHHRIIRNPHDRPFFVMNNDELRHVRGRPVRDPRELMPDKTVVHPRPQIAHAGGDRRPLPSRGAAVRPWPKESILPRIVQEDSHRSVQVHEIARDRAPLPTPRREVRATRADEGIPVTIRRERPERIERDDRNDRNDRNDDDQVRVQPRYQPSTEPSHERVERPSQPAREKEPSVQQPSQRPTYQPSRQPSYQPQGRPQVQPQQQRPTAEEPRGFTQPVRRDPPRQVQPSQPSRPSQPSQPSRQSQPQPQPQPQPKPQVQQPAPQPKPVVQPSKSNNSTKPSAPSNHKKGK